MNQLVLVPPRVFGTATMSRNFHHCLDRRIMKMTAASSSSLRMRAAKKKHRPRRFLRKLVNFLKSDSYMFAPIISSSKRKYGFSPRGRSHVKAAAAGFEVEGKEDEDVKMKKRKKLVEYLTSDSYLYAPLIQGDKLYPPPTTTTTTSQGTPCMTKKVTTTVLSQLTEESSDNVTKKAQIEPRFDTTNHKFVSRTDQMPNPGDILKHVAFPNRWKSLWSEEDLPVNGSTAERVAHRRKIHVE